MDKSAKYISKYRNLTIAIKRAYYREVEGQKVLVPGNRIEFNEGFFETTDPELVTALEARADFGTAFVRIPENKTVDQMREAMRTNDEKERALKAKEEALDAREKELDARESGRSTDVTTGGTYTPEVLEGMKRSELVEVAKTLGVDADAYKVGKTNVSIAQAILAKQAEVTPPEGQAEGGGTGSFAA